VQPLEIEDVEELRVGSDESTLVLRHVAARDEHAAAAQRQARSFFHFRKLELEQRPGGRRHCREPDFRPRVGRQKVARYSIDALRAAVVAIEAQLMAHEQRNQ
jgi:hypothetical protein